MISCVDAKIELIWSNFDFKPKKCMYSERVSHDNASFTSTLPTFMGSNYFIKMSSREKDLRVKK